MTKLMHEKEEIIMEDTYYIECTDEECCFCCGPIYTTDLDGINAECINCKAQFILDDEGE